MDVLHVPSVPSPGSIMPVRADITVLTETPRKPRRQRVLPVPVQGLPQSWLMPQAAGSKPPPLFTISNPTPCFSGADPPIWSPSLWGCPAPCAVTAPSLGQ